MSKLIDTSAIIIVACLWGCTNPLLRHGSKSELENELTASKPAPIPHQGSAAFPDWIKSALGNFRRVRVYLPFLCNQLGSVLFYFVLSRNDLSLAVPACNALALIFSVATSHYLGETVNRPLRAVVGAAFVMIGLTICMYS